MTRTRKKSITGWIYGDEDLEWLGLSAWTGSPIGMYICILKHKKALGKFGGKKVKITIEEIGGKTKKGTP